jgi:hypothetical protein
MSGLTFGVFLLVVRLAFLALRRTFAEVGSCASRYHFADMHLGPVDWQGRRSNKR